MTERYIIYTSTTVPNCPSCILAKALLDEFNLKYTEIMIGRDLTKEDFQGRFGADVKTVPQITIDGRRIGGYESLKEHLGR